MGCLAGPARFLLVIVNILFLIVGIALTACGCVLKFGESLYKPFLKVAMNELEDALKNTSFSEFDVDSIDIGKMVESLAIGLIVGGLVLVAISFLGCCGACCKSEFMLWVYAIVIVVFVVIEIVGIGLLYGKPDLIKDQLKNSLTDYEGLGSSKVFSLSWNIVMIQFKCCGVDSYEDFSVSTNWEKNPTNIGAIITPLACCKKLPESDLLTACAKSPFDSTISNGNTGCFKTLWDLTFANHPIVIPVLVICGIIQVLFIIFAVMVIKDNNKVSPI